MRCKECGNSGFRLKFERYFYVESDNDGGWDKIDESPSYHKGKIVCDVCEEPIENQEKYKEEMIDAIFE